MPLFPETSCSCFGLLCSLPRFQVQLAFPDTWAWTAHHVTSQLLLTLYHQEHLQQDAPLTLKFNQSQVLLLTVPQHKHNLTHSSVALPRFSRVSPAALTTLDFSISFPHSYLISTWLPRSLDSHAQVLFLRHPRIWGLYYFPPRSVISFPFCYHPIHSMPRCRAVSWSASPVTVNNLFKFQGLLSLPGLKSVSGWP